MGALNGVRIVEFGGIGPGPFSAMMLAEMGAEVLRLDRVQPSDLGIARETRFDITQRSRPSVALDLQTSAGREAALRLIEQADALIEGYRPGVMERLGLGPDICLSRNPALVYGRMTGWGQTGPLAQSVGHDLNYLALSGILSKIGPEEKPAIPLSLIGDYGGGAMFLSLGVVAALFDARESGRGQVVDAAMVDGITTLFSSGFGSKASGELVDRRESNSVDGGAPWYGVYETKDGRFITIAPIERKFYRNLLELLGLGLSLLDSQFDRSQWPALRQRFEEIFRTKTRTEWEAIMEGHEICFAPVLTLEEAMHHPHMTARGRYAEIGGIRQPVPAPNFSRTPSEIRMPPRPAGADSEVALANWGFSRSEIARLIEEGVVVSAGQQADG
ncbi:MAG: CoA transferase [Alphaproteobacteria bacterium]|nr:MAG: CoA transferase [Alphaproteobacteria bacterium]